MRAGKLNNRITIQTMPAAYDSYGAPNGTWVDSISVWSNIEMTGGNELYQAKKLYADSTAVFKVRYTTSISTLNRIKYGTRYFEILSIGDPDGLRVELLITAKEVV